MGTQETRTCQNCPVKPRDEMSWFYVDPAVLSISEKLCGITIVAVTG